MVSILTVTSGKELERIPELDIGVNTYKIYLGEEGYVKPVYGELKYTFNRGNKLEPYLRGDIGYYFTEDMEESKDMSELTSNGYSSMGVGIDVGEQLTLELMYGVYSKSEVEEDKNKMMFKFKYDY